MQIARSRNTLQKSFNLLQLSKKQLLFPSTRFFFSEQQTEDAPEAAPVAKDIEIDTTITSVKKNPFSNNRNNWNYYQGQIKASLQASNKAYIRTKFESSLLNENIVEIPALRFRRKQDTITSLKLNREVACVLNDDHYVETDE